ncbi:hypothetical protein BSP38_174 [Bacillus phage BSP38]|uniref:Uncharacterized protein n=1 Tax=Bacillus phage BSP38 TaxID=2283013 RepID=A0A345MK34_BPBSP|nr:hypothetical protein HWB82_gp144 [Bacillus phage BSP38]AXH71216.1 hypothetical protein BSP38_174 [Bacillus phage BSP38]
MEGILKNLPIGQNSAFWNEVDKAVVKLGEFLDQELSDSAKEEVILILGEVLDAAESMADDAYDEGEKAGYSEGYEEGYDIAIDMNED